MHKTSLITAIALLIFICSCRQRPPVSPGSPQTYLIPEAGIQVEFPGQPQFGPVPTYSAYFSETRSYDCMQPYRQDTVPYGTHVGVYYNKVSSGSPEVLDDGLKAMREMIYNTQKATVLVNEKIQFLGLPAHRMRIHVEASQPFYVSVIMIARGPYCVELSTFEGAAPGVKESIWKNHSFFQTVSFTDPVPLSVMLEPREGGANCRLFPCYLKEQQIIAWFPEAPSIKRAEVKPGLNVIKYQIEPYEENKTLFYSVEFYEGARPLGSLSDSVYIVDFLKSTLDLVKFSKQEKLTAATRVNYKGKTASDLLSTAPLGSNPNRIRAIDIHSRIFVHRGRMVRALTYRKEGFVENYPSICFFDWMVFL